MIAERVCKFIRGSACIPVDRRRDYGKNSIVATLEILIIPSDLPPFALPLGSLTKDHPVSPASQDVVLLRVTVKLYHDDPASRLAGRFVADSTLISQLR